MNTLIYLKVYITLGLICISFDAGITFSIITLLHYHINPHFREWDDILTRRKNLLYYQP